MNEHDQPEHPRDTPIDPHGQFPAAEFGFSAYEVQGLEIARSAHLNPAAVDLGSTPVMLMRLDTDAYTAPGVERRQAWVIAVNSGSVSGVDDGSLLMTGWSRNDFEQPSRPRGPHRWMRVWPHQVLPSVSAHYALEGLSCLVLGAGPQADEQHTLMNLQMLGLPHGSQQQRYRLTDLYLGQLRAASSSEQPDMRVAGLLGLYDASVADRRDQALAGDHMRAWLHQVAPVGAHSITNSEAANVTARPTSTMSTAFGGSASVAAQASGDWLAQKLQHGREIHIYAGRYVCALVPDVQRITGRFGARETTLAGAYVVRWGCAPYSGACGTRGPALHIPDAGYLTPHQIARLDIRRGQPLTSALMDEPMGRLAAHPLIDGVVAFSSRGPDSSRCLPLAVPPMRLLSRLPRDLESLVEAEIALRDAHQHLGMRAGKLALGLVRKDRYDEFPVLGGWDNPGRARAAGGRPVAASHHSR